MYEDLQKAYKIIKKEFGKRRYKTVNSTDEIKLDEVDSSIVLYYHDKNWENVDDILEICHHAIDFVIDGIDVMISIERFWI